MLATARNRIWRWSTAELGVITTTKRKRLSPYTDSHDDEFFVVGFLLRHPEHSEGSQPQNLGITEQPRKVNSIAGEKPAADT
jgi:hypothetical protein